MAFSEKMLSWIPPHFKGPLYDPYTDALGKSLDDLEVQIRNLAEQTFIELAETEFLNIHGNERGFPRLNFGTETSPILEKDENYQSRIRRLKYTRTDQNILDNVRSVAGIISAHITDDEETVFFDSTDRRASQIVTPSGETYGSYGPLDLSRRRNCFTVWLTATERLPFAFYDEGYHFDQKAFMYSRELPFDELVATTLKRLIQQKMAAGKGFRLLIKDFTGLTLGDEAAQERELNEL